MENEFKVKLDGTTLNVYIGYELLTENAPMLKKELLQYKGKDIQTIVFDATDLVFIESNGIRTVIFAQQEIGHSPKIFFLNCASKIQETLALVGITNFITFVEDERKNDQTAPSDKSADDWQKRFADAKQKELDNFAANNDLVMYQMKLGKEDD